MRSHSVLGREDYQRLREVWPVKGERLPAGRGLSGGEIAALMAACTHDMQASRH